MPCVPRPTARYASRRRGSYRCRREWSLFERCESGFKLFAQCGERAAKNSTQCAIADPQQFLDTAVIHFFEVTQGERAAMEFGQFGERRLKLLIQSGDSAFVRFGSRRG